MVHPIRVSFLVLLLAGLARLRQSNPNRRRATERRERRQGAAAAEPAEAVTPPFAVSGELDGLLLVWFDAEGPHTASRRSEVPETARKAVRVDSLAVSPDKRLDPEHVYVADLSQPGSNGQYTVHKHTRSWFEAQVEAARPAPPAAAAGSDGVTVYMASWCGACKAAAAYLRSRNVRFEEKDIEKDPQAKPRCSPRRARPANRRAASP